MEKRITPDELADMLMRRVYVPFSAVAAVNGRGEILSLCQFDTAFADQTIAFEKSAEEIWLLSNHPEGCMRDDGGGRGKPAPPSPGCGTGARAFFPRRRGHGLRGG